MPLPSRPAHPPAVSLRARGAWLALALVLALGPLAGPLGASAPDREALNRAINAQVRRALRSSPALGVVVEEVASGDRVYAYDADRLRIVASNTKLFTTAAALHYLGPGFTFETPVFLRGPVVEGVLVGDLAVVGHGDPTVSERFTLDPYSVFRSWARALAERGVHRVNGDLVLVDGYFRDREVHPDWPSDQLSKWYEAPVSALSFNDNCVWVRVSPTSGGRARVDVLPPLGRYPVVNLTRTGSSARHQRVVITRHPGSSQIEVRGYVWRGADTVDAWVTVPDPVGYFGAALRAAFAQEGIEIKGATRPADRIPPGAWERVAVHRTNLLSVLQVILERSQNFFAESLLKTLGAERCGDGTWAAGLEAVAEFLDEEVGIPRNAYRMADGSGMSRGNRFTPDQLVRLLRTMYYHRWGRAFLQSLPYSGEEGLSWERRLAGDGYRGNVFAKTGTLTGVSALSGYVKGRSGTLYAFSILGNGTGSTWKARDAQDRIVRAIIDNG